MVSDHTYQTGEVTKVMTNCWLQRTLIITALSHNKWTSYMVSYVGSLSVTGSHDIRQRERFRSNHFTEAELCN